MTGHGIPGVAPHPGQPLALTWVTMRLKFGGVVESFWRGSEIEMVSVSHLIVARKACLKRRWRHFGNYSPSVKRLPGKCLALCTSQRSVNRIGLRPSGPRSRPSTNDRKPRTPAGKGEGAIGSRAAVRAGLGLPPPEPTHTSSRRPR